MNRTPWLLTPLLLLACGGPPPTPSKPGVPLPGTPTLSDLAWAGDTLYAAGTAQAEVTLGNTAVAKPHSGVIYALDQNLNPKWIVGFGATTLRRLVLGPKGDLWFAGEFEGVFGGGGHIIKSRGGTDCVIGRVSTAGDVRWATHLGGPGDDRCPALVVDAGGAWLGGQFHQFLVEPSLSATGPSDGFVARISADGSIVRGWTVGGPGDDTVQALALAGTTLAVTGTFTQDFKPRFTKLLTPVGGAGAYVLGLNPEGKISWARVLGHQPNTLPHRLIATVSGGWAASGEAQGAAWIEGLNKGGVRTWIHAPSGWTNAPYLLRDGSDLLVAGAAQGAALLRLSAGGEPVEHSTCGGGADTATALTATPAGDVFWVGRLATDAPCANAGGVIAPWTH
jgi:hypothetical protein